MCSVTKSTFYLCLSITATLLIAIYAQSTSLLNWDVSFLMHASKRLLAGGTYTNNFFETNPPMIMYLYAPAVLFAKLFSVSLAFALRFYTFSLGLGSIIFCYFLGKKIFQPKDTGIFYTLLFVLSVVFFILPGPEFGQREHVLVILIMPYLFSCAIRLNNQSLNTLPAFTVGLLAGLGFAIKPFFLIPLVLEECYFIFYKRALFGWVRVETITIFLVLVGYLISAFIITPDYMATILPLLFKLYYSGLAVPLDQLMQRTPFWLGVLSVLFYFAHRRFSYRYHLLGTVLLVALVGFLCAYLVERMSWYYHLLPAVSVALLLLVLLFYSLMTQSNFSVKSGYCILLLVFWFFLTVWIFCFLGYCFVLRHIDNWQEKKWFTFISNQPDATSLYFITTSYSDFSMADYTNKTLNSRFPCFWWLAGIMHSKNTEKEKNYLINLVAEDLEKFGPELVFVDAQKYNPDLQSDNIDYITYLSTHDAFKKAWKNYVYWGEIPPSRYHVYRRVSYSVRSNI